jgi:hypothetical protein
MKASDIPTKFPIPFANSADPSLIETIPVASQIGITPGRASLTTGFVPLNFDPPSAGGVPPLGKDFNGLHFQETAWLRWVCGGGTVPYDAGFQTGIGGYFTGATVTVNGVLLMSTIDDNMNDPTTAPATGWVPLTAAKPARYINTSTNITLLPTDYRLGVRRTSGVAPFDIQMLALPIGNSVKISDLSGNFFAAPVRMIPPAGHDIAGLSNYTMNIDAGSWEFAYFGDLHWDVEQ